MRRMFIIAGFVLALDQITKFLVLSILDLQHYREIDLIPPYLNLRMAWNYGINFGLLDISRWVLIGIAVSISVWIIWWMRREKRLMARISAGMLIGGAAGNVMDRLIHGAVADFLNMSCCGIDNPYAFNVADIAIFAGAAGLILFTGDKKTP